MSQNSNKTTRCTKFFISYTSMGSLKGHGPSPHYVCGCRGTIHTLLSERFLISKFSLCGSKWWVCELTWRKCPHKYGVVMLKCDWEDSLIKSTNITLLSLWIILLQPWPSSSIYRFSRSSCWMVSFSNQKSLNPCGIPMIGTTSPSSIM